MAGSALLHVNIRTVDLERTREFYERFAGLRVGERPPFATKGYWLYAGEAPVLHLVERRPDEPDREGGGAIDHIAFQAHDLAAVRAAFDVAGIPYRESIVPGDGSVQIFLHDPNGIRVELAFPRQDAP